MFGAGALDNYSKDPELEKLVAEGGASSDPAVRKKAYSAAIKLVTEKAYWMPVHTYVNRYAFTKTLEFKTYPDELPASTSPSGSDARLVRRVGKPR